MPPSKHTHSALDPKTTLALKAVAIRKQCGRYAASQYARNHGVSALYRLALQLSSFGA